MTDKMIQPVRNQFVIRAIGLDKGSSQKRRSFARHDILCFRRLHVWEAAGPAAAAFNSVRFSVCFSCSPDMVAEAVASRDVQNTPDGIRLCCTKRQRACNAFVRE